MKDQIVKNNLLKHVLFLLTIIPCSALSQWQRIDNGLVSQVNGFHLNGTTLFCATDNGLYSTSNRSQWTLTPSKDNSGQSIIGSIMYSVHFSSSDNGLMTGMMYMGNSEVIFQTTDAGLHWTNVSLNNNGTWPRMLNKIYFKDSDHGYAIGTNGRMLVTSNGGTSWSAVSTGTSKSLNDIVFANQTRGFIVGDSIVLTTDNGGSSWIAKKLNSTLVAISFFHPDSGYIAGGDAIYSTYDGGGSWNRITPPVQSIKAIYSDDSRKIVIGCEKGILFGLDKCAYFEKSSIPAEISVNALLFTDSNHGYAGCDNGQIYYTENGGGSGFPIASITRENTEVCPDSSLNFSAYGPSTYLFTWLHNGENAGSGKNTTIQFTNAAYYDTITLIVNNGANADTAKTQIYVRANADFTLSASAEKDSVCQGSAAYILVKNSIKYNTYLLKHGETILDSVYGNDATLKIKTPLIDTSIVFTISSTVKFDCRTITKTVNVPVWTSPFKLNLPVHAVKPVLLTNDSTEIIVESTDAEMKYLLLAGTVTIDSAKQGNGSSLSFRTGSVSSTTTYTVKAINKYGCERNLSNSVIVTARYFYLRANPLNAITIVGDTISFTNTSVADTFIWKFDSSCSIKTSRDSVPAVFWNSRGEKEITLIGKTSFGVIDSLKMQVHVFEKAPVRSFGSFCRVDSAGPKLSISNNTPFSALATLADSNGNYCVAGHYRYDYESYGYFIRKFNAAGAMIWAHENNNIQVSSSIAALTSDSKGNIYAGGSFRGNNLILGTTTIQCDTSKRTYAQGFQNFIVKLKSNGDVQWVIQGLKDVGNYPSGVTSVERIDDNHFLAVIVNPSWYTKFTDTTVTTMNISPIIVEFDSSGNFMRMIAPKSRDQLVNSLYFIVPSLSSINTSHGVAVNPRLKIGPNGKIYIYGKFLDEKEFDQNLKLTCTGKGRNGYIAVIDYNNWKWENAFALYGSNETWLYGTAGMGIEPVFDVDDDGNIYIAESPVVDGFLFPGSDSMINKGYGFVAKYNSDGQLQWRNAFTGAGFTNLETIDNNLYLYGSFGSYCGIFSQRKPESAVKSNGWSDVLFASMTLEGEVNWIEPIGSAENDIVMSMAVNPDKRLYLAMNAGNDIPLGGQTIFGKQGLISIITFSQDGNCTPYPVSVKNNTMQQKAVRPSVKPFQAGPIPAVYGKDVIKFALGASHSCLYELKIFDSQGICVYEQQGSYSVDRNGTITRDIMPWNMTDKKGQPVAPGSYIAVVKYAGSAGTAICVRKTLGVKNSGY